MKPETLGKWVAGYWVLLLAFSVWTFSLSDPNLLFSTWPPYWRIQQDIWHFFAEALFRTEVFVALCVALFFVYAKIVIGLKSSSASYQFSSKKILTWFLVLCLPLIVSYNALSYDIFNYLFNAKMVLVYGLSPYTHSALDFPQDTWTRFMHNTHTLTPYGYLWTFMCFIPFLLGFGKFTVSWLLMKLWMVFGVCVLYWGLQYTARHILKRSLQTHELALLFLNPFFLFETVSSAHNDIWMGALAVWAVGLSATVWKNRAWYWKTLCVGVVIAASIEVKFVTVLLIPLLGLQLYATNIITFVLSRLVPHNPIIKFVTRFAAQFFSHLFQNFVPLTASIALFLPLMTDRSFYFHPWYLLWPLVWLPLIQNQAWKRFLLILSFTSLMRYIPWMLLNGYAPNTLWHQQLITWAAVPIFFIVSLTASRWKQPDNLRQL